MSEHKGPRPVAWEGWHATVTGERPREGRLGCVDVQELDEGEHGDMVGRDYTMTPAEAERHGLALIMAAAVARGEQGHAAALNRLAAVLEVSMNMAEEWAVAALERCRVLQTQLDSERRHADEMVARIGEVIKALGPHRVHGRPLAEDVRDLARRVTP